MVGVQELSKHCHECGCCFSSQQFSKHKCTQQKTDCIVCLGELEKTIYGRVVLNCGHQLHSHCYHQLINNGNLKCPICKKFLPSESDKEQVLKWQLKNYSRVFIPLEYDNYIVKVKCCDCMKEFP